MNSSIKQLKRSTQINVYAPHFKIIDEKFGNKEFKLLDVGCGPNSVRLFKTLFPNVEYYGIDFMNEMITPNIKTKMNGYYELDLNDASLEDLQDNYFDCVVASHVIEHLTDSIHLIERLAKKIKPGGFIFIEYPGLRSTKIISTSKIPFVKGTLNFYDDKTHVHIYDRQTIVEKLNSTGFRILKNDYRKNYFYLFLTPLILPYRFISNGFFLRGSDLWDFTGFAEIVYARKEI